MIQIIRALTIGVLFTIHSPAFARGADNPQGIIAAYDKSIAAQSPGPFMNVCDNNIGTMGAGATCGALLKRGWKEKISLKPGAQEIHGAKATLDVLVERDGKTIESLYFLLVLFNGKWLLKSFSDDLTSKANFLSKDL